MSQSASAPAPEPASHPVPPQPGTPPRPRQRLSASTQSLLALVLGGLMAWFLGPYGNILNPLGMVIANLFKMLSLPMMILSLIHGLARWSPTRLTAILRANGLSILGVLFVTIGVMYAASLAFPEGSSTFDSAPSAVRAEPPSLLKQFFSPNIFEALASGAVPAVALFCILFAWRLSRVESKESLLAWLKTSHDAVWSLNRVLGNLMPIMIFALMASSGAAVTGGGLGKLSIFAGTLVVVTVLMVLLVLPGFAALLVPVPYLTLVRSSLPVLMAAFLSSSVTVVMPLLGPLIEELIGSTQPQEGSEEPTRSAAAPPPDEGSAAEEPLDVSTILFLSLTFPDPGQLVALFFVLYMAAAFGQQLALTDHLTLVGVGLPTMLTGAFATVTSLVDRLGLPADAVSLWIVFDTVGDRLRKMLSVQSLIAIALLTHFGLQRQVRLAPLRLLLALGLTLGVVGSGARLARGYLSFPPGKTDYYVKRAVPMPPGVRLVQASQVPPVAQPPSGLERLRRREPFRIGLDEGRLPFSYRNGAGQLSGGCVALAGRFSTDVQGPVEWVVTDTERVASDLAQGRVDVMFGPLQVTTQRLLQMSFGPAIAEVRPTVLFPDLMRTRIEACVHRGDFSGLRVGVRRGSSYAEQIGQLMPGAAPVLLPTVDDMFASRQVDVALCQSSEASAYEVTQPRYDSLQLPTGEVTSLAFAMRRDDVALQSFVREWLELQKVKGVLGQLQREWVYGQVAEVEPTVPPIERAFGWLFHR